MGNLFSRFSVVGVSVVAAALIFGFLAGGVVVHRFQTASQTSTQQEEQPEKDDQQGEQKGEQKGKAKGHDKSHATDGRTTEPPASEGSD